MFLTIWWCFVIFEISCNYKKRCSEYLNYINLQYNRNVSSYYANGRGMVIDKDGNISDSVSKHDSYNNLDKIENITEKSICKKALFDEIRSKNTLILISMAIILTLVEVYIIWSFIKK